MKTWLEEVREKMIMLIPEAKEYYNSETRTLKENMSFYREKLRLALVEKENVMNRFYNIKTNKCKPILMEKITLDRIIKKHGDNGLINISAWRSNLSDKENEKNTRSLISDLQKSGYSYLPGYGGYRDPEIGEESDFEPSFNVFNYNSKGEPQDFEKLKDFGIYLANKYEQSSVLVKSPNNPPIWLNGDGQKVSKNETNTIFKNDANQEYFTSLKSPEDIENVIKQYYIRWCKDKGITPNYENGSYETFKKNFSKNIPIARRYTYDIEWGGVSENTLYVNPTPCNINERRMRTSCGEILVDTEIV